MRSSRLTEFMSKMEPSSVAIFLSAPEILRNADTDYEFRQDSDFYALTGLNEPESVAVISPGHDQHKYVLFLRPRNKEMEIWNGLRAGIEGAISEYGADAAYDISQLGSVLPKYLENNQKLYYRFGQREANDLRVIKYLNSLKAAIRAGKQTPSTIIDPSSLLHELRLRKTAEEIDCMRTAARISAEGHIAAMKACKPGMYEYELEALVEYVFRSKGAGGVAYQSIVGSGFNSTILHYNTNNAQIKDGDLVLIDAGAEYKMFAGDITRTFPANGKYSKAQQAVYELVLHSNKEVIKMIKPGESFMALHEKTIEIITQGLIDLGLLSGDPKENAERKTYERFFMHRTGHWLGMDVHDVGRYKLEDGWRKIEAGMAFTVEPGIYIQPGTLGAGEEFHNIGIRVEDDIVVTQDGCEVLTSLVPKEVAEIESLMKETIALAV
jgi:Xaa-Pro aminopeptidase